MKPVRLAALAFAAILAVGALATSTALASTPEFKVLPLGPKFTATSGVTVFAAATDTVTCTGDTSVGEITSMDTVGRVVIKFTGCQINTATCSAKFNSLPNIGHPGEVVFNTVKGRLGTVKTSEAATGVGILIEPETGTKFFTVEKTACTPESTTSGDVAAEVSPVNSGAVHTGLFTFTGIAGHTQKIKHITVLGVASK